MTIPTEQHSGAARETEVFVALVHYPVVDKHGKVVTTSVTNLDVHDIARSSRTYGVSGYYVVTPTPSMQWFVRRVIRFWIQGAGAEYNLTRRDAFALIRLADSLEEAVKDIEHRRGRKPVLVATSARPGDGTVAFSDLRKRIESGNDDFLLILGTGWGLDSPLFAQTDLRLAPIEPQSDYNHLSVRAALAIMLDRLLGSR
jgi:hypothetical protein